RETWRRDVICPPAAVRPEDRHQVLRAGKDEDVRLLGVTILGQAFVRLSADRGDGEAPAEPERAVAGPRVVREAELELEACAARARGERDRERARSRDRVDAELLTDAANCSAALGQ